MAHTLTKGHACLQQRSTLSDSPLAQEMVVILGRIEYVDPPNVSFPIPVQRRWGKFPLMLVILMGLAGATHPHGLQ